MQQQPKLLTGIDNQTLRVGTLDSFIIWHWTAGKHYLTDASMAARTLLMDIYTGLWSKTLTDIFAIPMQALPKIHASTHLNLTLNNGAILQVSFADQSAALLANVTFPTDLNSNHNQTEILVNLGTGGFVVCSEPNLANNKTNGYLRTLVFQDHHSNRVMAIEGTINSITSALEPYPFYACKIEDLANIADLFCSAEPTGIGAPFFRSDIGLQFPKPMRTTI